MHSAVSEWMPVLRAFGFISKLQYRVSSQIPSNVVCYRIISLTNSTQ